MVHTYEIHTGERQLAVHESPTALAALLDFIRSQGYEEEEVLRLGETSLSWRGAVFRAVEIVDEPVAAPPPR